MLSKQCNITLLQFGMFIIRCCRGNVWTERNLIFHLHQYIMNNCHDKWVLCHITINWHSLIKGNSLLTDWFNYMIVLPILTIKWIWKHFFSLNIIWCICHNIQSNTLHIAKVWCSLLKRSFVQLLECIISPILHQCSW